ncbi:BMP family lipoprotein [Acholeplasma hippikon]|uniref:Purine nucleoside receptor A n=1 Tax=Acholeplasma hippikon TaxID=264636 RepID=A0A449BJ20_9MOLU|nr:BMP family ABC transporter substrate-binding protein [Acholeplasma hippikon]VEU82317.1 Purine nucleoside receptor A [Acholeplasma hippikon]
MKKIITLSVTMFLVALMAACKTKTYEIAMITVYDSIQDGSFNQATWEGIQEYAVKNNVSHQYYQPLTNSEEDYLAAINRAVNAGAKIIITPGLYSGFETKYPHVKFVILDGLESYNKESDLKVAKNALTIYFNEHESGFLAGYAAVKDGFRNLGFIGGVALPTVKKFGIGFVAGAYYASYELNESIIFDPNHYNYLENFSASDKVVTLAESYYDAGVEIIHAAAGAASHSVIKAAENKNAWVIGVDIDQSRESSRVLTSAIKGIGAATYQALVAFYENNLSDGEVWHLGADDFAVSIPFESSRFTDFNFDDYTELYQKIIKQKIHVPSTKEELTTFLFECRRFNEALIERV